MDISRMLTLRPFFLVLSPSLCISLYLCLFLYINDEVSSQLVPESSCAQPPRIHVLLEKESVSRITWLESGVANSSDWLAGCAFWHHHYHYHHHCYSAIRSSSRKFDPLPHWRVGRPVDSALLGITNSSYRKGGKLVLELGHFQLPPRAFSPFKIWKFDVNYHCKLTSVVLREGTESSLTASAPAGCFIYLLLFLSILFLFSCRLVVFAFLFSPKLGNILDQCERTRLLLGRKNRHSKFTWKREWNFAFNCCRSVLFFLRYCYLFLFGKKQNSLLLLLLFFISFLFLDSFEMKFSAILHSCVTLEYCKRTYDWLFCHGKSSRKKKKE